MKIYGNVVDIHNRNIFPGEITISNGKIKAIHRAKEVPDVYIMPGLIDAHVHIESSMITPGAFAVAAVKHGTVGAVSDPHEIANVLGIDGIEYMINDAKKVPMNFWFGAPSCVPATSFETSGAKIDSIKIERLLQREEIKYMGEMMNFPGVIYNDTEVHRKLNLAKKVNKPIDGHAPGLSGERLKKYVQAGISTDHECSSLEEAQEKISLGMKILIREGSAARNLTSLKELFSIHPEMVMLCSDDLHPEMLIKRHINKLIAELISDGYDLYNVIRSATIAPVLHYNLDSGLLLPGQNADFIIVDTLEKMNVMETWIRGTKVYGDGSVLFEYLPGEAVNNFNSTPVIISDIKVPRSADRIRIIKAFDGELLTKEITAHYNDGEFIESDTEKDILKIVVKDRYNDNPPVAGFINGFGLIKGAFASSIAHDSHNIISVGTNDHDIVRCINEIITQKGGLAVSDGEKTESLKLDIAGIMTSRPCSEVASSYEKLNEIVKNMGCKMSAPFMTLSFMALLVIPDLKIGDRGLFDVNKFELTSLFVD